MANQMGQFTHWPAILREILLLAPRWGEGVPDPNSFFEPKTFVSLFLMAKLFSGQNKQPLMTYYILL